MRLFACGSLLLVAVACSRPDTGTARDTTATATPPAASLADFAGTWQVRGNNEAGDSIISYRLVATGDTTGWTMTFPGREPVPVRVVSVAGDSVIAEAGPYASALRPGVQVRTHSIFRRSGDTIVGVTHARYDVRTADSLMTIRSTGTRVP